MRTAWISALLCASLLLVAGCSGGSSTPTDPGFHAVASPGGDPRPPLDALDYPFSPPDVSDDSIADAADDFSETTEQLEEIARDVARVVTGVGTLDDCLSVDNSTENQTLITFTACGDEDVRTSGTVTLQNRKEFSVATFDLAISPADPTSTELSKSVAGRVLSIHRDVGSSADRVRQIGTLTLTEQNAGHPSQTIYVGLNYLWPASVLTEADPYAQGGDRVVLKTLDYHLIPILILTHSDSDLFDVNARGHLFTFDTGTGVLTPK